MAIRSQSVGLVPEVEDLCMNDLSKCFKVSQKGEVRRRVKRSWLIFTSFVFLCSKEIRCLQKNYLELEPDCQNAVRKFTKTSMSDASLDFYLVKSCENIIQLYCSVKKSSVCWFWNRRKVIWNSTRSKELSDSQSHSKLIFKGFVKSDMKFDVHFTRHLLKITLK